MRTVREVVYAFFRAQGMTTMFGNPGSTELPFLADFPDDFTYVLGLHEAVAAGMADAYAQVSSRPAVVNLHTAPGVGNARRGAVGAALARPDRPVLAIAGHGSAQYAVTALWTAARHVAPVTFLVLVNSGYQGRLRPPDRISSRPRSPDRYRLLMTGPARARWRAVLLWTVQIALAALFAVVGTQKLVGTPAEVALFDAIGFGPWFRYASGICEVAGAVGLLIPRLASLAALGLAGVMAGAALTGLLLPGIAPSALVPVVLAVVLGLIAYARRSEIRSGVRA